MKNGSLKRKINTRLAALVLDDKLKNKIYSKTIHSREGTEMKKKARLSVAAIVAICALCLMTTVVFAAGIPQSIFAYLQNRYASSPGKDFAKMDELAVQGVAETENFFIDQAYYDGQQLSVGITYDKSKVRIRDGVYLANGEELARDTEDEDVNADGTDWLYIKFATPLPESAQNKDSLEVVFTLQSLDASASEKTVTASIPRSTDDVRAFTADREYGNYAAHIKVSASPVDTRIDVTLKDVPETWTKALDDWKFGASVDYVYSYILIADGKVLDGAINRSAGTEMFGTYAPLPKNTARLVLRPVYTLSHENAAEDILVTVPQK